MKILMHRGNTEIGASCLEIQSDSGARIIIDAGLELEGEKAVLPKSANNADAVFISHAHPDHFGLVGGISKEVPAYCGAITENIMRIMGAFNNKFEKVERNFTHFQSGNKIIIKDVSITPFITDHSVPDSYAFLIETDGKSLFYSGDFRTSGRKPYSATRIAKAVKNPDALIVEGTCIEGRESAIKTEVEVQNEISKFLTESDLPTFLLTSSINVDRLVSIFKAAKANKKIFVCDIYTALILWQMGKFGSKVPQMTWDDVKVLSRDAISKSQRISLEKCFETLGAEDFRAKIYRTDVSIKLEEIAKNPNKYVVKNSQIENIMQACGIGKANLIYSMWSGYLAPNFDTQKRYEKLRKNPAINFRQIHTSGHATKDSLFDFIDKLAPKALSPFHTNAPEKFLEKYPAAIVGKNEIVL